MLEVSVSAFMIVIILMIGGCVSAASCSSRWEDSGFRTDWGPIKGCRISKDGKTWVPEKNYREIP